MDRIEVEQRTIELSNPSKVLFPDEPLTKRDLVKYYRRIADVMLPHIEDRPLSLRRFPDGIDEEGFYQQQISNYFPDWIDRETVKKEGGTVTHVVCNKKSTLVYLATQAVVTPHAWLSRTDRPYHPDRLVFDLDPPDGRNGTGKADFNLVRLAAKSLRDVLGEAGLSAFLMTTGSRGIHVVSPLDRSANFDSVRKVARTIASITADQHPDQLTIEHRKEKRKGRLFLDTTRNAYAQTTVPPYAVRARAGAPVATPLAWKELSNPDLHAQRYTVKNIFRRLGQIEDPWEDLSKHAVAITDLHVRPSSSA